MKGFQKMGPVTIGKVEQVWHQQQIDTKFSAHAGAAAADRNAWMRRILKYLKQ